MSQGVESTPNSENKTAPPKITALSLTHTSETQSGGNETSEHERQAKTIKESRSANASATVCLELQKQDNKDECNSPKVSKKIKEKDKRARQKTTKKTSKSRVAVGDNALLPKDHTTPVQIIKKKKDLTIADILNGLISKKKKKCHIKT
ncbi:hypothetical protein RFI_23620 [Reticulomyxa filosa]|uniref:Uncharacterized protein n=1 Tax=Reticulomyxa filosa TaxID=46433 RepID=X6MJW4_RETFI|nr:hypothetical protein RFI_23620 [Reticulomyxa filosa]|eukprot:ETO13747.1 hypothetical protein RFI_23620 [Reticulomyxa filosa]